MPKLPKVQGRLVKTENQMPLRVARYLGHTPKSGQNDAYGFAMVLRRFLDANPKARAAFIEWYEEQP